MSITIDVHPYPLAWPPGQARAKEHTRSRFGASWSKSLEDLDEVLARIDASNVVLSTNMPLRRDGWPRAIGEQPEDPGAALYFRRHEHPYVIACDTYDRVVCNVRAIYKTLEALRTIERHGSSSLMEQAFAGFSALPPARQGMRPWREVLGIPPGKRFPEKRSELRFAERKFRELTRKHHPDGGGDAERMIEINDAIRRARSELG